jgi:hypothetical protein
MGDFIDAHNFVHIVHINQTSHLYLKITSAQKRHRECYVLDEKS